MDKLARYKLDSAFTDGVEIYLDDAPDCCFLVKLPSQYNRGYTNAVYAGMSFQVDANGISKGKANITDARFGQQDAFIAHCIVSMDGEPLPNDFVKQYPKAVDELMIKANEMAAEIQERVEVSVKKSSTLSGGSEAGLEKLGSIAS